MNPIVIFDFGTEKSLDQWYIVNDGVMGGLSKGTFSLSENGHGVFEGKISLDNNGGFSSVRHRFSPVMIEGRSKAIIRLRGDGKDYQFRVKASNRDYHSYVYQFSTSGDWEEIVIPLEEMYPSFRGRRISMDNFSSESFEELTFLIGNKKRETFKLEIDRIELR